MDDDQSCFELQRRCPCGSNNEPNPENANNVRTVGSKTIAFCFERCARDFDRRRERYAELQLQVVAAGKVC